MMYLTYKVNKPWQQHLNQMPLKSFADLTRTFHRQFFYLRCNLRGRFLLRLAPTGRECRSLMTDSDGD